MTTVDVEGNTVCHRGIAPFVARSASDKTDDWPYWYVHGTDRINWMHIEKGAGTFQAKFCSRAFAEKIAAALNEAAPQKRAA